MTFHTRLGMGCLAAVVMAGLFATLGLYGLMGSFIIVALMLGGTVVYRIAEGMPNVPAPVKRVDKVD